ncbi:MAG TPA: hypothetical protein VNU01_00580 [Egibacteraceae bacterium]|nr:hypothetical protein [Egibacteraceae bacterium]
MTDMTKTTRNEEWGPYTSTRRVDIRALPPVRDAGGISGGLEDVLRHIPERELERVLERFARRTRGARRLRSDDED